MSTKSAIRALLREREEVEKVELPYLVGRDEREVRAALDSLADEVDVDHAGFVSLRERPAARPPRRRPPRGITAASLKPEAERSAAAAGELAEVVAYREAELGGELTEDPAEWIERRKAVAAPFAGELDYLRPDSEYVARVRTSPGSALERLRVLGHELATQFGWIPALATTFVLTGWTPPLSTGRRTTRRTFTAYGALAPTTTHERFTDDDADAFATAHVAARAAEEVGRRQPSAQAAKYAALVPFVEERRPQATWDEIRIEWNREYPEWPYRRGDKLADAYRRAR